MNRPFRPLRSAFNVPRNDVVGQVVFVDDFMAPEECDRVLELAATAVEHEGKTGPEGKVDQARSSRIRFLWPSRDTEWLFAKLEAGIFRLNQGYQYDLLGFAEGAQVATYGPGGHYDWHVDLGVGMQSARKLSLSVQLSDPSDYDGGDLEFMGPTDVRAPRGRGALVAFPSFVGHIVHPVTRGERRSLVSWISGTPFR